MSDALLQDQCQLATSSIEPSYEGYEAESLSIGLAIIRARVELCRKDGKFVYSGRAWGLRLLGISDH